MTPIILFLFVAAIYVQGRQVEQTAKIDYLWNKQVCLVAIILFWITIKEHFELTDKTIIKLNTI